jgi:hypothetical protein
MGRAFVPTPGDPELVQSDLMLPQGVCKYGVIVTARTLSDTRNRHAKLQEGMNILRYNAISSYFLVPDF